MKNSNKQMYMIIKELSSIQHMSGSMDMKFTRLYKSMTALLGVISHALYYYDIPRKRFLKCYVEGFVEDDVEGFIMSESSVLGTMIQKSIKRKVIISMNGYPFMYYPIYFNDSLVGLLVLEKTNTHLRKAIDEIGFTTCLDVLGFLLYGIYRNVDLERLQYIDNITNLEKEQMCHNKLLSSEVYNTHTYVMCKITNMSLINLKYGYEIGNRVLHNVAHAIKNSLVRGSWCYRLYGPKIGILLNCNYREAYQYLKDLENEISIFKHLELVEGDVISNEIKVTVKFGLVNLPTLGQEEKNVSTVYHFAEECISQILESEKKIYIYKQGSYVEEIIDNGLVDLLKELEIL